MLELSARELGLLEVLLQRTGRLVSKEQLVDHLCEWGEEVSNNAIEVYVHRLRKKIEVGGVRIATVRDSAIAWRSCPRTALPRWRPNAA
jgi:two-component system OmpR family response regulator